MSTARIASMAPLIVLLPACGASLRAGPKVSALGPELAVQGEATIAGGIAMPKPQTYVGVPITVGVGSRPAVGETLVQVETGIEAGRAFSDSPLGFRISGRVGGAPTGPSGVYLGFRLGPTFAFEKRESFEYGGAQNVPVLSLEAFISGGASDDIKGQVLVGGALTFGTDFCAFPDMRIRGGRPLRGEGGSVIAAPARRGKSWRTDACPDLTGLRAEERARLGEVWLEDARMEHASIATFAALALQLLALGAPADLVEAAHRAALDEARHARLCFSVASAYLGRAIEPGALPLDAVSARAASVEEVALASLFDGAFGEGLAAAVARARARVAVDPRIRKILGSIARDEARHAELAWSVITWCISEGGPRLRAALEAAWSRGSSSSHSNAGGAAPQEGHAFAEMEHHGIAGPGVVRRAMDRTRRLVTRRLGHVDGAGSSPWPSSGARSASSVASRSATFTGFVR